MNWFPEIPTWDGIHPALVHFPVVLLLMAPLLLLVSLFARRARTSWTLAALAVMALGATATWFASGSGHAAGQLVDKTALLEGALTRHEALGMRTRDVFTALTLVLAGLILLPTLLRRAVPEAVRIGLLAVYLTAYMACTGLLTRTADQGGRLVHEYGVRAVVGRPTPPPTSAVAADVPMGEPEPDGARSASPHH